MYVIMPMQTVYVYVPNRDLDSILKYGLLSNRAQYELFGKFKWRKYQQQYEDACKKYDLNFSGSIEEKIIKYLDWRTEPLKGSKAIYVLYAPIPDDPEIREYIRKYRGDFLKNRTLIKFKAKNLVNIGRAIKKEQIDDPGYWKRLWKRQMDVKDVLWFEGIPHAYFVPSSGYVSPQKLNFI